MPPSLTELQKILRYAPSEGAFYWLVNHKHPKARIGMLAGRINKQGRAQIGYKGSQLFVHRLVWLFETGAWPTALVDHRDGNPLNNMFANLRVTDYYGNSQNQQAIRPNNKSSKLLGVSWHSRHKKWIASIKVHVKKMHLGYYTDANKAHAAYVNAKRIHHPLGQL
jgi:hypothetical protein